MPKFTWYAKRLRVMSTRELLYRGGQQLTLLFLFGKYLLGRVPVDRAFDSAGFKFCLRKHQLPALSFDLEQLGSEATSLFECKTSVAGASWQWEDSAEIWHHAPDTGRSWPRIFFGRIPYRDGNPYGDIRQLWEPSRLQHLVNLAVLGSIGNNEEREQAADIIQRQLVSWVKSNPPLVGAHYISSMECALRIIAVSHTLDILRDNLVGNKPWEALIQIVATHAPLIERRLSLHSSAGNHTIAEAAGLVYSGLLFPEMKGADNWLNMGITILEEAAKAQVLPDGGGAEQAVSYHLFNIQLLSLVEALMHHCGQQNQLEISAAVERGSRFLQVIGLNVGWLPTIGDSDGGHALSRHLRLAMPSDTPRSNVRTFPDTGLTVAHIGCSSEAIILFDHGPLGMPPSYGHGHADALSLLLRVNGEDVFIDPGTYTYTGDSEWRQYFRSTRAHNTVTVNANDQAKQEGCFLWSKPYHARLIASEFEHNTGGRMVAEHDGYLDAGVRHVRGIAWSQGEWLIIWDGLFGDGKAPLALHWHMSKQPRWIDSERFELQYGGKCLGVHCRGGKTSTFVGARSPISGWQSPSYGSIEPISTVRLYSHASLPHSFTTTIGLQGRIPPDNEIEDSLKWIKDQAR